MYCSSFAIINFTLAEPIVHFISIQATQIITDCLCSLCYFLRDSKFLRSLKNNYNFHIQFCLNIAKDTVFYF
jgi:hypothetical protein